MASNQRPRLKALVHSTCSPWYQDDASLLTSEFVVNRGSGRRSLIRGTRKLISLFAMGTGTGQVAFTFCPGMTPVPAQRKSVATRSMRMPRRSGAPAAGALFGWSTTVKGSSARFVGVKRRRPRPMAAL